jgi:hypothetical protein
MSDEKNKKKRKCSLKCNTCENYNKETDFCVEKEIENCSKQVNTDFSQCDSFLIRENLVMF